MTAAACRAALKAAAKPFVRAAALDDAFPECACEEWSLSEKHPDRIDDEEWVARILTSPDGYDETANTIVTQKLSDIYSLGMSVIRQGASDDEILGTIADLTDHAHEDRSLVGAIVMQAKEIRAYLDGERWFGVYGTDDRGKSHHGDVFGTFPDDTASQKKKITGKRRYRLCDDLLPNVLLERDPGALIVALRGRGL